MSSLDFPRRPQEVLPKARKPANGLQAGILAYIKLLGHDEFDIKLLPKKYTLYSPLLILPINFTSVSPEWQATYRMLGPEERQGLFSGIAAAFKPQNVTHIAINAAINPETVDNGTENFMRSPRDITLVYGDFGPATLLDPMSTQPTQADFDAAFWISASQNGGIIQTWAPRWTMFSRGNITEKARILGQGNNMIGLTDRELGEGLKYADVVDFYVGIGYFALSYLKRGARTVFGWDINAWSVEGLRRGCQQNGWGCFVAKLDEGGGLEPTHLNRLVNFLSSTRQRGTCVAFQGDNKSAPVLLAEIDRLRRKIGSYSDQNVNGINIRHVSLGLLPTARASWKHAVQIISHSKGGWLHVHENVDTEEIESRRAGIVKSFENLVNDIYGSSWDISCCHVELVKSFAPGVMHCVFDVDARPLHPT